MLIVGKLKLKLDEIRVRSKFPELDGKTCGFGAIVLVCFSIHSRVLCRFPANGASQLGEIKFRDMTR